MEMNVKDAQKMIKKFAINKKPLFIHGTMGIGKSDNVRQIAKEIAKEKELAYSDNYDKDKFSLIDIRVSQLDSSDLRGIPTVSEDGKSTKWLVPNWLPKEGSGVIFFDEINLAPPMIQSSCFKGDTLIPGVNYKEIKNLEVGDKVIDMNGDLQKVEELKSRNYNGDMFKIKGRHFLSIDATEEHPFYIRTKYRKGNDKHNVKIDTGKSIWTKARDLKVGDYVGIPKLKPTRNDKELLINLEGDVKKTIKLTDEFARFIGYYVGDGYYSNGRVGIALNITEKEFQKDVSFLIEKVFGKNVTKKNYNSNKNCIDVGFYSKEIGLFLKKLCGINTYHKKIPSEILYHQDRELLRNFLIGYHNADGHTYNATNNKSFLGYTTVSKQLALQVQQAYTRFGILVAISTQPAGTHIIRGKEVNCKEAYRIQSSQKKTFDVLNIKRKNTSKRITEHFFEEDEKLWARIDKIDKYNFKGKVYNCEVENTHSYLAHNYIVHNCYQLILDRKLGDYVLPDGYTVIAAGNRAIDGANVFPMGSPLKNRFSHLTMLVPSVDEWIDWAIENNINSDVIGFLLFKESSLHHYDKKSSSNAFPTPRSWSVTSDMLKGVYDENPSKDQIKLVRNLAGCCVGEGAGRELTSFIELKNKININDLLENPHKVRTITEPDLKYSLVAGIAEKYKKEGEREKDIKKKIILSKGLRIVAELDTEFGVFMLRLMKTMCTGKFTDELMREKNWEDIYNRFSKYLL